MSTLEFNSYRGLFRQFLHALHLTAFSFLLGNILMDYLFGKKGFTKEDFILLGKSYSYAWFTIIATGIWQIMVISKQHNYIKNKNYMTWVYILVVKTLLALITAYGLEFIAKFIPQNSRRLFLKYSRLICFFLLFLISGINREWRETQLIHHKGKKSNDKKKDDDMKMDDNKKDD